MRKFREEAYISISSLITLIGLGLMSGDKVIGFMIGITGLAFICISVDALMEAIYKMNGAGDKP